jgi:hypothetical protein
LPDALAIQRVIDRHDHAVRRVCFADLFEREDVGEGVHACAAICFGDFDAHEAHPAHFFDGGLGEFSALIMFGRDGRDLVFGKIAGGVADHFVFFA